MLQVCRNPGGEHQDNRETKEEKKYVEDRFHQRLLSHARAGSELNRAPPVGGKNKVKAQSGKIQGQNQVACETRKCVAVRSRPTEA